MRNLPPLTLVTSDDEPPLLPALSSPFGLASGLGGIFSEIVGCQTERSVIRKNAYLLVNNVVVVRANYPHVSVFVISVSG